MDIQKVFDQQAEIDERAWDVFTSEYERRTPPPQHNARWQIIGLNIGLFAAMVVSSIFTIQAFMQVFEMAGINMVFSWIGSTSGFLMIDAILFFLTHFIINLAYKQKALSGNLDPRMVLSIAIGIAVFTFFVSVASNLYFVFIGFGVMEQGSEVIRQIGLVVGLLLGTAPPIQSIAVGTIIAMQPMQLIVERREWETSRQRAWFTYRRKHGLDLSIEARLGRLSSTTDTDNGLSDVSSIQTDSRQTSGAGYTRVSSAIEQAIEYLKQNPDAMNESSRTLAEKIGVGKDSVIKAKRELED